MISRNLLRVALLLAGTDASEKELYALLLEMRQVHPEELLRAVLRLREYGREATEVMHLQEFGDADVDTASHGKLSVVRQVERLLRGDAGLTIAAAGRALGAQLKRNGIRTPALRAIPEKANSEQFGRWLARLAEEVPPGLLLHHATALRNEIVHVGPSDWSLKK